MNFDLKGIRPVMITEPGVESTPFESTKKIWFPAQKGA